LDERGIGERCEGAGRGGAERMGAIGVPGRGPGETTTDGGIAGDVDAGGAAAGMGAEREALGGGAENCRAGGGGGVCGGNGCRGPEIICPGRAAGGAGRAGMAALRMGG
jgi:hypothetical protein